MSPRLYIDFIRYLPTEICLKILESLDPTSLISVARTCKAWHALALDQKLWRRLYTQEGWHVESAELERWQDRVNSIHPLEPRAASEDRQYNRKRAISDGSDVDCEMLDADRPHKQPDVGFLGGTAFQNPTWSFASGFPPKQPATPGECAAMDDSKGKGRSPPAAETVPRPISERLGEDQRLLGLLDNVPPRDADVFSPATLWNWEPRIQKYVANWKYLYSMRRRLEMNWELGRFTNFQFPHPRHPEEGHTECIYTLQFTSDYLVSGSRDRSIRVWSIHSRRLLHPPLLAHSGSVLCLQFDPDPEEDLIVSGSSDSDVILWRFSTGKIIQRLHEAHHESVLNIKFDKRILVTCSKDKSIKIFNRRPLRYGDLGYPESLVNPVPINVKNYGEPNLADELPVVQPYTLIGALIGHNAAVNAVQIHNRDVVSASGDKAIKVWDWPRGKCTRTVVGHTKGIACVQYDGRRIVTGSSDNEIKVFDAPTGLEVASLRAHSNLVRTVQAGFGDIPGGVEIDRDAAKKIDEQFFKAVESGAVPESALTSRVRRRGNAGSSRPEHVTAFGATLPPGGGGGKYARIVSGSYDQSIIIWRRDKEGVWKDIHHLQQEKAAATAQREMSRPPPGTVPRRAASSVQQAPGGPPAPRPNSRVCHPSFLMSPEQIRDVIDTAVPQGLTTLRNTLALYPSMLTQEARLQAAIDAVGSPHVRNQMRGLVVSALETVNAMGGVEHLYELGREAVAPGAANASSTAAEPSAAAVAPTAAPTGTTEPEQAAQPAAAAAVAQNNAAAAQNGAAAGAQVAVNVANAHAQAQAQAHHPLPAEFSPARIFKLQFDARRIICCCQSSVIVGWDFCNGDRQLEAVSRFFSTIS